MYAEGRAIVPAINDSDSLYNDGYGSRNGNQQLTLEPSESLYLVEKERIAVVDEDTQRTLSFQEILARFSEHDLLTWTWYVIYRDLRSRGFVVKPRKDSPEHFIVYERGTYGKKPPSYLLHVVPEGVPETMKGLSDALSESEEAGLKLKLAVVDRRSEVVYYSLGEANFVDLGADEAD